MLFNDVPRMDNSPKGAFETEFGFLDRCSWVTAEKVRDFMEVCIENYPITEQAELIARIRSGDDRHFKSATFELFLHEYLRRQNFVLIPHPTLENNSTNKPDFLVACPDGSQFYLEAVLASSRDARNPAGDAIIETTLHFLDSAHHPNFFVKIQSSGSPISQPSGRRLAKKVLRWLDSLDADVVFEIYTANQTNELPSLVWNHERWSLTITAIPCRPDARGQKRRLIGMLSRGASWIDDWTPIRNAIIDKGNRYGEIQLPLIVAVNVETSRLHPIDEAQALFGQEQLIFPGPRMQRAANGAWVGPGGPRTRKCSGAWLFHDVSPYTLARRKNNLYMNPNAYVSVPASALSMPHAFVQNDELSFVEGMQLGDVFEFPSNWPE